MKTHFITFLLLVGMSLGISSRLHAQSSYQPGEENLKAREEFQDNKFGIFLHWGLYAMLATGEWTMTNNNLNYKEYAKLAGRSEEHTSELQSPPYISYAVFCLKKIFF